MKIGLPWLIILICTTASQCPKVLPKSLRCGFDEIQQTKVPTTKVQYFKTSEREKRSNTNIYSPIRITPVFTNLNEELDNEQVNRLKRVVRKAVTLIEGYLSVIPVSGSLLLARDEANCLYTLPEDDEKCVRHVRYDGESCLDNFQIPDDHLEGLWEWDNATLDPTTIYPDGSGLSNTDFVLYVRAKHTSKCDNSGDIRAYAKYCSVDQYGRPVAGYSNFCPLHINTENDEDALILTAAHEIFHTLGFSGSLYDTFQDCTYQDGLGLDCEPRHHEVVTDSRGQERLATPAIINKTQQHFGCSEEEFGGPLESMSTSSNSPSSHWEARLMYGSLMTATIGLPHLTLIDPITLAVFEDTGWYKVNYDNAQDLVWGQDQGCEFGQKNTCDLDTDFFCNDNSSVGCHHLLKDKANCSSNSYLEECSVYKADKMQSCLDPSHGANINLTLTGEYYDLDSRCFIAHLESSTSGKFLPSSVSSGSPKCFRIRCNDSETLEIQVGDTSWQWCPSDSSISIPGYYSIVECPTSSRVCREEVNLLVFPTTTAPQEVSSVQRSDDNITLELIIAGDYTKVVTPNEQEFKNHLIEQLASTLDISRSRIKILSVESGSIVVTLQILSSEDIQEPSTYQVLLTLEDVIANDVLMITYNGVNYRVIGISILEEGLTTTAKEDSGLNGQMLGVIIGVLAVCFIVLFIVIIALCKTKKKRRVVAPMYMEKQKANTTVPELFMA